MTQFIASNAWIGGVFFSGYLARCAQNLLRRYKVYRAKKLREWEWTETHRILDDLVPADKKMTSEHYIAPSPKLAWSERNHDETPATAWDRAGYLINADEDAWLNDGHGRRRTVREWWVDWKEATKPRSPDQVALEAYEAAVLEGGETYTGAHRTDGYTEREVACLNTHTAEFPSLRHLRVGWKNNPAPVPAEVLT